MRRLLALALVTVGLTACGSNGSSHLSKAEYSQHVRSVGAELKRTTASLGASAGNLPALATATAKAQRALMHAAGELAKLDPPPNATRDNRALVAGLRAVAREMGKVHHAAQTHNRAMAEQAAREIASSRALLNAERAAKDLQRKGYDIGALAG